MHVISLPLLAKPLKTLSSVKSAHLDGRSREGPSLREHGIEDETNALIGLSEYDSAATCVNKVLGELGRRSGQNASSMEAISFACAIVRPQKM